MPFRHMTLLALLLALAVGSLVAGPAAARPLLGQNIAFAPIFTYSTGLGEASAETVASQANLLFVTNSDDNSLDIVDLTNPGAPTRIDLSPYGGGPNSVAVRGAVVAVAVEASPKTDPGKVVFFALNGQYLNQLTVGALPDMLTFSPDGRWLLVANEGEPNSYGKADSVDPEGSVSVIAMRPRADLLTQSDVRTAQFTAEVPIKEGPAPGLRIFGPGATLAQDLEPEYITVDQNSVTAYVTLQENNGLAVLDIYGARFKSIVPLGRKDHSLAGSGLDASDRDNTINIAQSPVYGLYQPDAIAGFSLQGQQYLVTANEGDARDYSGFSEEARVGSLKLDPAAFPNAADLQKSANLGRLNVTKTLGDADGDGLYEELYAFGARSFSIWDRDGGLVYDSGDTLEQIVAATYPAFFNSEGPGTAFDSRSDNKGPEPEGVDVGRIGLRTYAFIGLERIGGVMIFDITTPTAPVFVQYVNNADFAAGTGDRGPEVVHFIPDRSSPSGKPRLIVANEISGTVTIFELSS